jgi:hypothetical protein
MVDEFFRKRIHSRKKLLSIEKYAMPYMFMKDNVI